MQRENAEGLSDKIIVLCALDQSTRDISHFFEENYGSSFSAETICHIMDKVWLKIQSWQENWSNLSRDSDGSLVKLVYLDCCDIRMKWPMSLANWSLTAQQLCVRFGGWFAIL